MKILFVTFSSSNEFDGGNICSKRNYTSLCEIYGKKNVLIFRVRRNEYDPRKNKYLWYLKNIFVDIFELGFVGLDKSQKVEILEIVKTSNIGLVFLDSSLLGIVSYKIKKLKKDIRIVTFFHNMEFDFYKKAIIFKKDYLLFYRIILAYLSEKLICKYADEIIALNERDAEKIMSRYNRSCDKIIPISINDKYTHQIVEQTKNPEKIALFVGSYFFPNVHGLKWFVSNVLPSVNMKLIIVGSGMDKLKEELQPSSKFQIFSNVPSLNEYYEQADFMVFPIFTGGGMKVKTAEALMFGKYLIGTKESFMGYDINSDIGISCDSSEEFINAIENIECNDKFNSLSRELFLKKYSFQSTIGLFESIFIKPSANYTN